MFVFVAVLLQAGSASARQTVSLNFGWRTVNDEATKQCAWPHSLDKMRCYDLHSIATATSPTDCTAAACAANQQVWQFAPPTKTGPHGGCWVGNPDISKCNSSSSTNNWVGAAQAAVPSGGGNPPAANAPEAQPAYKDASWTVVDIPHDATVTGEYSRNANGGEGFLPPVKTWYRKHFVAPDAWKGMAVTLVVDASLSTTTWWLNGKQVMVQNPAGYLPYILTLDTNGLVYGSGGNVLTAFVDGGLTTGWWYEGSGLIRGARLVATAASASIAPFGIASPAYAIGAAKPNKAGTPARGLFAESAVMTPAATITTNHPSASAASVKVDFTLYADDDGTTVVGTSTASGKVGTTIQSPEMNLGVVQLWTVARPYLYTLAVTISVKGVIVDATNETVGIRNIAWDGEHGLLLNDEQVKMRGACNHESFTGVGAALPARIDLLRIQQMRGVGMNAWRTSHNPPEPVLLDIADRLGIIVLDENRVLATKENCVGPGCKNIPNYAGDPAADMGALAKRDRNHASVLWYSLCNEAGCGNGTLLAGDLVEYAKQAAYTFDGSRAVGANMGWISPVTPKTAMSDALDVMGMSHANAKKVMTFHAMEPTKPLVMTECCSCQNQRGEDADMPHNSTLVHYTDEVAGCIAGQVAVSDAPEYVGGTFVWTLHDYMGEPGAWPHVSSSFGAIDLAGFAKPLAWWYRSVWLSNISSTDPGRPPLPTAETNTTIRIVEAWQAGAAAGKTSRTIHVYSNAPLVGLFVNGAAVHVGLQPVPYFEAAVAFQDVAYTDGTLTAKGFAADGKTVLAEHTTSSWGAASKLTLTMDVPSLATGTGTAVYVDGEDVALLRASVVDSKGNLVRDSSANVTFTVTDGPGYVAGVGNGDPACQEPSQVPWRSAYHGLVRGIIRVTVDASGTEAERALRATVNADSGAAPRSSKILQGPASAAPKTITVTASSPGLSPATFIVPLSVDPTDAVLVVASASINLADVGGLDTY